MRRGGQAELYELDELDIVSIAELIPSRHTVIV
jgi:hypothetical protein